MNENTILISGSNGLTGTELIKNINNIKVLNESNIILANRRENQHIKSIINVREEIIFDLKDEYEWLKLLKTYQPDQVLNISNIRHSSALLDAIKRQAKKPKIYIVGTTAVHSRHSSCNYEYRWHEQKIRSYEGDYCILRPSMIYGNLKDKNMHKVIKFIKKYRFFPVFGDGTNLMQPVYYKDLSYAIGQSLELSPLNLSIDISGDECQTYFSIIENIFSALHIRAKILRLPIELSKTLLKAIPSKLKNKVPVSYEQLIRLQEDKSFDNKDAKNLLKYNPLSFKHGIEKQIEEMYT